MQPAGDEFDMLDVEGDVNISQISDQGSHVLKAVFWEKKSSFHLEL